jgi:hypothetical protein
MILAWHRKHLIELTLSLIFALMIGSKSYATSGVKLPSDDDYFGEFADSVSISDDVALVGATGDSAYVFRWNGAKWVQEQKLLVSGGAWRDQFGDSVSISGDGALIGAWGANEDIGSAYVFRWDGTDWEQEERLLASDGAIDDYFGASVSLSANVAIVGAYGDDDKGSHSGSAYVFRWDGTDWEQEQKLLASDGAAFDGFGGSVSISGNVALVGAPGDDDNGHGTGSAYVFRWNGAKWVQEQKLVASDGAHGDTAGGSVSISGDVALVGADGDDDNGDGSGSAYVFRWNGAKWVQEQKLLASDGDADDEFGESVSINGAVALVGAPKDDDGSAYVFRWNGTKWVQEQKLVASDCDRGYMFGKSVSTSGALALVGSNCDSAYVFALDSQRRTMTLPVITPLLLSD